MYAQDSIELLTTSGIQFKKHEDEGIETLYFAELLMTSGVVLCDGVKWLSFHRYSVDVPVFVCSWLDLSCCGYTADGPHDVKSSRDLWSLFVTAVLI